MIYNLLHKNIKVLTFDFLSLKTPFIKIISLINEEHLPVGILSNNNSDLVHSLNEWWDSRLIPHSRKINKDAPAILDKYYSKSFGLNLSDHYWIKPLDSNINWDNINYYTNDFDEDIGKYIITYGRSTIKEMSSNSPDLFSNGEQDK